MVLLQALVVRLQARTGIPKWKMSASSATAWCFANILLGAKLGVLTIFIAFLFINCAMAFGWWNRTDKYEQRIADERQKIVPNWAFYSLAGFGMRLMTVGMIIFDASLLRPRIWAAKGVFFTLAVCISHLHTFPMQGPPFKERLKNLVSPPKQILAPEV